MVCVIKIAIHGIWIQAIPAGMTSCVDTYALGGAVAVIYTLNWVFLIFLSPVVTVIMALVRLQRPVFNANFGG